MKYVMSTLVYVKNTAFILLAGYYALLFLVAMMKPVVSMFN